MKKAFKIFIILIAVILSQQVHATGMQPVLDVTNLVQNIQQTLKTIHLEHASLVSMAQRAEMIGQKAQIVINLQNQLMVARKNLESIQIMIQTGQYKSINELNALCFQVQRIGFTVSNIKTGYEMLFPEEFKSRDHTIATTTRQEKELNEIIKGAMIVESEAIKNNKLNAANIKDIMKKSQKAVGLKAAMQANTALLAEISSQNMEMKKLLAMISRVNATKVAKDISDDKKARNEHERFMKRSFKKENTGIMTKTLKRFTQAVTFGYSALVPDAMALLKYFIIIEVFFFGVLVMFTNVQFSHEAIKKIMAIGFYVWLIPNIEVFSWQIMRTFAQVGVVAGKDALTVYELFDPSAICLVGLDAAYPIFDAAGGWSNPFDAFMLGLTGLVIFCSFLYVSWVLFMSTIEFYIVTVTAVWLMPFSLFKPLQFISERTVSAAFALSIRFMVIAITLCGAKIMIDEFGQRFKKLLATAEPEPGFFGTTLPPKLDLTLMQSLELMAGAGTIAIIFFGASRLSSSYFGGSPALGGSALISAIRTATKAAEGVKEAVSSGAESIIKATSKHKEATNA